MADTDKIQHISAKILSHQLIAVLSHQKLLMHNHKLVTITITQSAVIENEIDTYVENYFQSNTRIIIILWTRSCLKSIFTVFILFKVLIICFKSLLYFFVYPMLIRTRAHSRATRIIYNIIIEISYCGFPSPGIIMNVQAGERERESIISNANPRFNGRCSTTSFFECKLLCVQRHFLFEKCLKNSMRAFYSDWRGTWCSGCEFESREKIKKIKNTIIASVKALRTNPRKGEGGLLVFKSITWSTEEILWIKTIFHRYLSWRENA